MPFISTKTNVNVSKEKEIELKEKLGQAISQAMKQIKSQEAEREHPKPGQLLNFHR